MFDTIYNESEKSWHGVDRVPVFNRDVSIGQVMLDALERHPNGIAQVSDVVKVIPKKGKFNQFQIIPDYRPQWTVNDKC